MSNDKMLENDFNPIRYVYKVVGDACLDLFMYLPKSNPKGCVVFIHGGGWKSENIEHFKPHSVYFAQNGAVAINISYRLLDDKTDIRDGLKDCIDALMFVRKILSKRYGILPITVIGDSAGGYYATALGCCEILKAVGLDFMRADYVVDLNGIVDLTGKWNYGIIRKDTDVLTKKEIERRFSPLFNISRTDSSVLIIHGDNDKTVDVEDSKAYSNALKQNGIENECIILSGASHAFILFDYKHERSFVTSVLETIAVHLKNKGLI